MSAIINVIDYNFLLLEIAYLDELVLATLHPADLAVWRECAEEGIATVVASVKCFFCVKKESESS